MKNKSKMKLQRRFFSSSMVTITMLMTKTSMKMVQGIRKDVDFESLSYVNDFQKNHPDATYEVGINSKFSDISDAEFEAMFMTDTTSLFVDEDGNELDNEYIANIELSNKELWQSSFTYEESDFPKELDWRNESLNPAGINAVNHEVRNQGKCGSCYAQASIDALEMTAIIEHGHDKGIEIPQLSVEEIILCHPGNYGCNGGTFEVVYEYIRDNGITSEEALPLRNYTDTDVLKNLKKECPIVDNKDMKRYSFFFGLQEIIKYF